jgi:hypothetical protein
MARNRKSETDLVVSAAAPTPARRKPSTSTRKKHAVPPGEAAPAIAPEAEDRETADAVQSAAPVDGPAHEEVAALAYSYWEARGRQGGSPEEDWLRAVEELRQRALASA